MGFLWALDQKNNFLQAYCLYSQTSLYLNHSSVASMENAVALCNMNAKENVFTIGHKICENKTAHMHW